MAQPNIDFSTPETPKLPTVDAYEKTLPEILALPEDELITINIDVMAAVTSVTGALPEIRAMRDAIAAQWRNFDFEQFDKLEQYTLALNQAHSSYRSAFAPKANVAELAAELTVLRDKLLVNAQSLASMGLINSEQLKNVKVGTGYRALASDVLTLDTVFRENWAQIASKTPFSQADLHAAGSLALELVAAVGQREQAPVLVGEAALMRQKAFTLFVRAYDEARRAVLYLRAKAGDADSIAPSLYQGRAGRRRSGDEDVTPPPPSGVTPSPNGSSPAGPLPIVIDNQAGLPVDNPFTS